MPERGEQREPSPYAVHELKGVIEELLESEQAIATAKGFFVEHPANGLLKVSEDAGSIQLDRTIYDYEGIPHTIPHVTLHIDADSNWVPVSIAHPLLPEPLTLADIDPDTNRASILDHGRQTAAVGYLETLANSWRFTFLEPSNEPSIGDYPPDPSFVSSPDWFTQDQEEETRPALFTLGQLVATPGALEALEATGQDALDFITRHVTGDWGDLAEEDRLENELSLKEGYRILSAYHLSDGTKIWLITEADRSATTVLLPQEY